MSSRPLLRPQLVANAISMDATASSIPSNINMLSAASYTLSWENGAHGDFTVEVSNDYVPDPSGVIPQEPADGTWVALPLSNAVSTTGTAGTAFIDVVGTSAAWIRLTFTNTSNTGGTWTATLAGKC